MSDPKANNASIAVSVAAPTAAAATTTTAAPAASGAPSAAPATSTPAAPASVAAEPADPNATETYLAIGSMINPVSLSNRGLHPTLSRPAILYGFELVFQGELGMASVREVVPSAASDTKDAAAAVAGADAKQAGSGSGGGRAYLHGVVHTLTAREMAVLDRIEAGYDRRPVTVTYYDGTTGQATVYQFKTQFIAKSPDGLPSERYIDIITRGCEHFGVDKHWIAWLRSQKVVPRKAPHELARWNTPEPDPHATMTVAQLATCDGRDGRDLCVAINNKVVKYVARPEDSKVPFAFLQTTFGGRDITLFMARNLYEPLFPVATCDADIHPGLRAVLEDSMRTMWGTQWRCVATLSDGPTMARTAEEAAANGAKHAAAQQAAVAAATAAGATAPATAAPAAAAAAAAAAGAGAGAAAK